MGSQLSLLIDFSFSLAPKIVFHVPPLGSYFATPTDLYHYFTMSNSHISLTYIPLVAYISLVAHIAGWPRYIYAVECMYIAVQNFHANLDIQAYSSVSTSTRLICLF